MLKEVALHETTELGFYRQSIDVNILKNWTNKQYLILDMRDCPSSEDILTQVITHTITNNHTEYYFQLNQTNTFLYPLNYLLLVDAAAFPAFSGKLESFQLLPNVEIVTALFDGGSVFLHQPYKVGKINELSKTLQIV